MSKNLPSPSSGDADRLLRRYWGHDTLRAVQRRAVEAVLAGRDTLALLPTGGGKSVCYQIPALLLPGLTVVVSPLIALMEDQVKALRRRGIAADYLDGSLSAAQQALRWEAAGEGKIKLLYITPERIATEGFARAAQDLRVSLIAVDEAHCISDWGHDFRPAYRQIVRLREAFPAAPVIALTATATRRTAADICRSLSFRPDFEVVRESLRRKNIAYQVCENDVRADTLLTLLRPIRQGSAIVYCGTRADVLATARMLEDNGLSAAQYHAGMNSALRSRAAGEWMRGEKKIMVATSAFGMGIDKPDVRLIVHRYLPASPEDYFQQAGRVARDGQPGRAVILYDAKSVETLRRHARATPDPQVVLQVYRRLCVLFSLAEGEAAERPYRFSFSEFCAHCPLPSSQVRQALDLLVRCGVLAFFDGGSPVPRVRILASAAECHAWPQGASARVLEALARSADGVFGYACEIDVQKLAELAELRVEELLAVLTDLASRGVVEYIPQGERSVLSFCMPRNDRIVGELLEKNILGSRQRRQERAEGMERYLYTEQCRARWIEAYFGEDRRDDCGCCDRCRSRQNADPVERILENGPLSAARIAQRAGLTLPQTISRLRELMDAGQVSFDGREKFSLASFGAQEPGKPS